MAIENVAYLIPKESYDYITMIAIPNMEKPQSCEECRFRTCFIKVNLKKYTCWLNGEECGKTDCPLIDIVTCEECIHHDDGLCHRPKWSIAVEPTDFCSYGERKGE